MLRAIAIRAWAFLITLTIALTLTFARRIYVYRQTLFANAAFMGRLSRMKALYLLGVDVNGQCHQRHCFTPLWGAAWNGDDDEVLFLLGHGADVNRKLDYGDSALMAAALTGHKSTVDLLLSRGANAKDDPETALTYLRDERHELFVLLQQAGAIDAP